MHPIGPLSTSSPTDIAHDCYCFGNTHFIQPRKRKIETPYLQPRPLVTIRARIWIREGDLRGGHERRMKIQAGHSVVLLTNSRNRNGSPKESIKEENKEVLHKHQNSRIVTCQKNGLKQRAEKKKCAKSHRQLQPDSDKSAVQDAGKGRLRQTPSVSAEQRTGIHSPYYKVMVGM
ncbi:hypothetical protein SAY86_015809 [Trapa natans]|uniref:Uncharacterized protein n=1 Tax=Trapa natans TaxID=22666 RepID=A0AAN7L8E8_TRANT|nr:hypothetical protein SAY86_015809 [Trapa natans]